MKTSRVKETLDRYNRFVQIQLAPIIAYGIRRNHRRVCCQLALVIGYMALALERQPEISQRLILHLRNS